MKNLTVIDRAESTIIQHKMASAENPTLLMVSGGSDSTRLAYIAKELEESGQLGPLAMMHVNHQLRGQDSNDDQKFVENLASQLGIPLFTFEIDIAGEAKRAGQNIEAFARQERYASAYQALESVCYHNSCPVSLGRIFTAHTQDDRVENFYMRSIVGTGPGGFRSMLYANAQVMRPLLDLSRQDLRDYLQQRQQTNQLIVLDQDNNLWREDATNAHTDLFRGFVRHQIVPLAKKRNSSQLDTLCRSMNLIADEDDYMEKCAGDLENALVSWLNECQESSIDYSLGCILLPDLGKQPRPLQRRVCKIVLSKILGQSARIESASVDAILAAFVEDGAIQSGYTNNICGNLAISANKKGVRIEPMSAYVSRRKPNKKIR